MIVLRISRIETVAAFQRITLAANDVGGWSMPRSLPDGNSGQRGSSKRPCWHPSGMPRWVGSLPVVSLPLHRPATGWDAVVWFFCFHKMCLCRWIRSASHKCSVSPIRNRTTPLSRSNARSANFQFRPRSDTSGNRISEVMPLLYSHAPSKIAKNLGGRIKALDKKKLSIAESLHKDGKTNVSEICKTLGISRATFYRNISANAACGC